MVATSLPVNILSLADPQNENGTAFNIENDPVIAYAETIFSQRTVLQFFGEFQGLSALEVKPDLFPELVLDGTFETIPLFFRPLGENNIHQDF